MDEEVDKISIICIVCPVGCELEVVRDKEQSRIIDIKGLRCPKGKEYACREVTDPRRVLMAVVKVRDGHLPVVSVKTAEPIPKNRLFDAVKRISRIEVEAPIKLGDIIVDDILGTGVPLIATNNVKKRVT